MFDKRASLDKYHLHPEELIIYILVVYHRSYYTDEIKVNYVDMLELLRRKDNKVNRNKILVSLKALDEKNIISIIDEHRERVKVIVHDDIFNGIKEYGYLGGFEKLYIKEMDYLFTVTECKINQIYAYLMVKGLANKEGIATLGYGTISNIMGNSKPTVISTMKSISEKRLITISIQKVSTTENERNEYRAILEDRILEDGKVESAESSSKIKKGGGRSVPTGEEVQPKSNLAKFEDLQKLANKNKPHKSVAEELAERKLYSIEADERAREKQESYNKELKATKKQPDYYDELGF